MSALDTIAMVITAPGRAAVGIIRLSGDNALAIAGRLYDGKKNLEEAATHTILYGWVLDRAQEVRIDEALFMVMRGPHSYTGEDVVEIQCHGGSVAVGEILRLCLREGARLADEGEFSKRAFINGKIDLTRAEAIMDIVDAKSDVALRQAVAQKNGVLERKIDALREALVELIAFIQADLDYPEDDIERLSDEEYDERTQVLQSEVSALIRAADRGRIFREGIRLSINGAPNVGKSSLLNALLGRERAIVTDIAGTTRDIVTEHLTLGGIGVEILDTAGIRTTDDTVEAIGVERAKAAADEADVVLYVVDSARGLDDDDRAFIEAHAHKHLILVANKNDLAQLDASALGVKTISISAKEGDGMDALESAITDILFDENKSSASGEIISNTRHLSLLESAEADLASFRDGLEIAMTKDILVIDLQHAWEALGLITGETASEDLLDTIFSKFCLGK